MSFDEFWRVYPRRVAKLAAKKAYVKALKLTTHEEIMAGVARYKAGKPDYADWCHPTTWLNQGRWADDFGTDGRGCGKAAPGQQATETGLSSAFEEVLAGGRNVIRH